MSLASDDRRALADALERVGPGAPTLCEGWTARDLVAHLVARETRPDSLPGLVVRPLAGWSERVRHQLARRPFAELVAAFRCGPPRLSPYALPGVDARVNLVEHFVHLEDVLRAQPGWAPREIPARQREALWRVVSGQGAVLYRHSPVGVVLVVPDGPRRRVRKADVSVVLTGPPEELLLHALGRTGHARVELSGPEDAVARFRGTPLGL